MPKIAQESQMSIFCHIIHRKTRLFLLTCFYKVDLITWNLSHNNGVSFSVDYTTDFYNLHGTDGYRGCFPWHGRGCPMGTGYIQRMRT